MSFSACFRPFSAVFPTYNGANSKLTYVKRPRRDHTTAAGRKLWTSRCRQYRVAF